MNDHIRNATQFAFNNNVADMQSEIESALQYKIINALEAEKIDVAKSLMVSGVSESKEDCDCDEDDKELKGNQDKLDVAEPKGKLTAADFKKLRKEDEGLDKDSCEETSLEESDSLTKGKKLVSTHGEGKFTAKVYYDPEWEEHQTHFYKDGKHMGEGPVSYHSGNGKKEDKADAQDSAEFGLKMMNAKNYHKESLDEKLTGDMPASKIIQDFVHSDNPKFKGKSKKERVKMALGAFYGMHKEEVELDESKPSAGLSAKEKSEVVKKAKSGKDIGKKGKGFKKIVAAAKKGGATDPKAVAAAAMWKNIKR